MNSGPGLQPGELDVQLLQFPPVQTRLLLEGQLSRESPWPMEGEAEAALDDCKPVPGAPASAGSVLQGSGGSTAYPKVNGYDIMILL